MLKRGQDMKKRNGIYLIPFDKIEFEKIEQMHDSNKKYEKLSDYMLKVIPFSCFWNKARQESRRLENLGFTFQNLPIF